MNILFLLLAIALFIALVLKNVPIVIATILSPSATNKGKGEPNTPPA